MADIIIDAKVRHGKPIIAGTRITVDDVFGWLESGMSYAEIKQEYGITTENILAALRYASSLMRGEEVHTIAA